MTVGESRVVSFESGTLRVRGIVSFQPPVLTLSDYGFLDDWTIAFDRASLCISKASRTICYQRLTAEPASTQLTPVKVAVATPLPAATVSAVRDELAERFRRVGMGQQRVREKPGDASVQRELDVITEDDTRYLRDLVRRIGWIDAQRFGGEAAFRAFLIVQHSRDLRLQLTSLPFVERDSRTAKNGYGEAYALLFDRVQEEMGKRQRYGTQMNVDAAGSVVLLPLEDPARVDEFRAQLGMPPLGEYLAQVKSFAGKDVRVLDKEERRQEKE